MPVDFFSAGVFVVSWGATYLMHSTALLVGVWVILKLNRSAGHSLCENLWKTALVGGVVTASAQMLLAPQGPFGEIRLAVDAFAPESSTAPVSAMVPLNTTKDRRCTRTCREVNIPRGSR